jgi:hypothetical protein
MNGQNSKSVRPYNAGQPFPTKSHTPMTDASTRTSRVIKAPREALYRAFTDLQPWLSGLRRKR